MNARVSKTGEVLVEPLTRREREILVLLAQGYSAPEIAQQLTLALSSVKWYVQQVYGKLGVNNKQRAIIRAGELGLLETHTPVAYIHFSPKHNLPSQLTSFIGREKEIETVKHLITSDGEGRLLTLTGAGGSGKTRLTLESAAKLLDVFPDGVWFIEFAPLADPALVPQSLLTTLGLSEQAGRSTLDIVSDFLQSKRALLILDNCEHLIQACAQLVETLLRACPTLHILATSREALGVAGETLYLVPTLPTPDPTQLKFETLAQYEAVRLFIERARTALPGFALTADNTLAVAQVCHQLDGIPLALELAAARVKTLRVEQIAGRLEDRFDLLTGGSRTALPRHRTLHALIDWSHDLLLEPERVLLRRLSVFAGGWTLKAAEAVCVGKGVEADNVLDLMTQLVNKSLILVEREQGQEARYGMLETIRQYTREKLLEAGGSENIRDKHLAYFVKLAEQAEPELYHANQLLWLNKLDEEFDNLRKALDWALTTNVMSGLRMTTMLEQFWRARGYVHELENWLWQLLERHDTKDSLHVRAMTIYCTITSDLTQARIVAEKSLQLARILSDKQVEALSLMALGVVISNQGNLKEGMPLVEQSLTLYHALGNKFGQAYATGWLGNNNNDLEHSKAYIMESLRLYRELGYLWGIAVCLGELAEKTIWEGDFSSPAQWLEEARTIYRQLGAHWAEARVLHNHGELTFWQGDYLQACTYFEAAIVLDERIGNHSNIYWSRVRLSYALLRQGNILKAKDTFHLCTQQFQRVNSLIGFVYAVEGLASLHVSQNQPEHAARLFAWAGATREGIGDMRPKLEQIDVNRDMAACLLKMGEVEFAVARAEGRAMTFEQAADYALETEPSA